MTAPSGELDGWPGSFHSQDVLAAFTSPDLKVPLDSPPAGRVPAGRVPDNAVVADPVSPGSVSSGSLPSGPGPVDPGLDEAALIDAAPPDTGLPETVVPDAGLTDMALPETVLPETLVGQTVTLEAVVAQTALPGTTADGPAHADGAATAPAPATEGRPARPGASGGGNGRHGKGGKGKDGKGGGRLKRLARLGGALVVLGGLVAGGLSSADFGTESSAEPIVQTFLLDWQQGHYTDAAKLTNGGTANVSNDLSHAFRNLNATAMFLSMQKVKQHGSSAEAFFGATVDLAGGGHQWTYQGHFDLVQSGGHWLVDWAPGVIEPSLGPGDRLAVVTTFAPRGQVTDSTGVPLIPESGVYYIGVYPGKLAAARTTAAGFSRLTGLNMEQVLGQISSAPPQKFLPLLTIDPTTFSSQWPALSRVSGLTEIYAQTRLFNYDPYSAVGTVGTENSSAFLNEGAAYQPGATIGESGLEQAYQDSLAGTPDIAVIVVNAKGHTVATPWTSHGVPGTPVRTTISGSVQAAANEALGAIGSSGQIAAVDAATGRILALAGHNEGNLPLPGTPLSASIQPGGAFTIVSAAALLANGLQAGSPLPCQSVANVGGQTFTYTVGPPSSSTFASDFAQGCGTAFATVSLRLSPADLAASEKQFGIGTPWSLPSPLAAFSGSASTATSEAGLAAQAIGTAGVKMSPLGMALVAAEVESGTGHVPTLLPSAASGPAQAWPLSLSQTQLTALRTLMRDSVTSGAARAANLPGAQVYGQAGSARQGPGSWVSWFVGYRGGMAFAVTETGHTQAQAAASLARTFLSLAN